ncbi:MAG: hypothetical protein LBV55_01695 [Acholeplasmatales bacterium]|jgi:ribonuclease HIII|nr:hypothetical protein [Acholeplasmatales bacterium]
MSYKRELSFEQVNKLESIYKNSFIYHGTNKVVKNENFTLLLHANNQMSIDGDNTSSIIYDIVSTLGIEDFDGIFCSEAKDEDNIGFTSIVAVEVRSNNYLALPNPFEVDLINDNEVIKSGRILTKVLPYKFYFLNRQENAFLNKNKVSTLKLRVLSYNTVILSLLNVTQVKFPVFIEPFCHRDAYIKNLSEQAKRYVDVVMIDKISKNIGYLYAKIIARYLMIIKKQTLAKR